jgi:hypothetical protein
MTTFDETIAAEREARAQARREGDRQVAALYPHARTFELRHCDEVLDGAGPADAGAVPPRTLTLVTPDLSDPSQDHLFAGAVPVLPGHQRWDASFCELTFTTSDGDREIRGHLRLTHSRLRAYGIMAVGGRSFAVQYEVKPQRYRMKIGRDAAYLAGQSATITWDTGSARWRDATWSSGYEAGFTFGVDGEEIIGDEKKYTFVAWFDDIKTGRRWQPLSGTYSGLINRDGVLTYSLLAGVNPPTGEGAGLFPYSLRVKLSEFGYDFTGGMVTGKPGYQGTVYGVTGDWTAGNIAGLYHLRWGKPAAAQPGGRAEQLIGVHDGTLYVGTTPVTSSELHGGELSWEDLPERLARGSGLPRSGRLTFSPDGMTVTGSSFGAAGERVRPGDAAVIAQRRHTPGLAAVMAAAATPAADGHDLDALTRMSQFTVDDHGRYYDIVQEKSMEDFYIILQNFMDPTLRSNFFNPNPPPLGDLYGIAHTAGSKGTDPVTWYNSLSVAYTASSLAKFSPDPAAKTLNGQRAETWISNESSVSDVMSVQGPLLYQRRYQERHDNLGWFLVDQRANAAKYAPQIDVQVDKWITEMRETAGGTPEELAELEKRIRALGAAAKKNKQFWAFALYTYTTKASYLNMLQVVLADENVDGSEFSQRVQRTVALLNVLDPTSFFSQEYAYLLQLFELQQLLPQAVDFSNDLAGFSFAVKQIIDKFIETYIDSPDPAMRDAAEQLQKHASAELAGRLLGILRTSAAVGYGLNNWGFLVATFERTVAKVFGGLPAVVTRMIAMSAAGLLLSFFIQGNADWDSLDGAQKTSVVLAAFNITVQLALAVVKRGVALAEVWTPGAKIRTNLAMFFSPKLMSKAQQTATSGLRGWLLQTKGPKLPADRLSFRQWWAARKQVAENAPLIAEEAGPRSRALRAIFGRNLSQFLARAFAAAFAIVGIVLSAIALSEEHEPLEQAANWLFLTASVLELVAAVGGWALGGSALAVGGMLVSTIFAIVSVVAVLALIAGVILLAVLWSRPQPTPVETFAKDKSGDFYMPFKAAIESFRFYQPQGTAQRAGVAMLPGGQRDHALTIRADGTAGQGALTSDGHTAFYITTDQFGRAQIGAPITDTQDRPVLFALGTDASGKVITKNAIGMESSVEPAIMWYADIQGEGTYEESASGVRELRSAPFKLRSAYWADRGEKRYLATDGQAGWKLADEGTVITLEMVATKPQELTMNNITWYTVAHDEQSGPALQVPGSEPRRWSLSPDLPEQLEFDPAQGTIGMRRGVDVPPVAKRTYTLTVTNPEGVLSTTFDLQVVVPPDEPALV